MKTWLKQQPEQVQLDIERTFIALRRWDLMIDKPFGQTRTDTVDSDSDIKRNDSVIQDKNASSTVSYAHLFALANGQPICSAADVNRALLMKPALNRTFRELVKQKSKAAIFRVAAASSGEIKSRSGVGFEVEIKPSKADQKQVYIQISLTRPYQDTPRILVLLTSEDGLVCHLLPNAQDGQYQWLEQSNSELVSIIQDRESEIYLC